MILENNNIRQIDEKVMEVDDMIMSSIGPKIWAKLPAIRKLQIYKKFTEIKEIASHPIV